MQTNIYYTFDHICESQEFEHDQEFVTRSYAETLLNKKDEKIEELNQQISDMNILLSNPHVPINPNASSILERNELLRESLKLIKWNSEAYSEKEKQEFRDKVNKLLDTPDSHIVPAGSKIQLSLMALAVIISGNEHTDATVIPSVTMRLKSIDGICHPTIADRISEIQNEIEEL